MAMKQKAKTRLVDLIVRENHLVGAPANLRTWLVIKNREGGSEMEFDAKTLEAVLKADLPADLQAVVKDALEKAAKCTPEAKSAYGAAMKIMAPHLDAKQKAHMGKLFDVADEPDGDEAEKAKKAAIAKALADEVAKKSAVISDPAFVLLQKQADDLRKQVDAAEQRETLRDATDRIKKDYAGLPISATDLAPIMVKIEKGVKLADGELAVLDQVLKSSAAIAANSLLFSEISKRTNPADVDSMDAWTQITTKAAELVQKDASGKTSLALAIDIIQKQNPGLYEQYLAEQKSAAARS